MFFDQALIDQIRDTASIVDVISEKIDVKKKGSAHISLCPFHNDTKPSMNISEQKQIFKCFSCGAGGDVFKFLMLYDSLSFVESVRTLAEKYNIVLPEGHDRQNVNRDLYTDIKAINEFSAKVYSKFLLKHKLGRKGREYLKGRALDSTDVKEFGLGYAPDSYDFLKNLLKDKYDEKQMLESGLFYKKEEDRRYFDFFRDRIMFPIYNVRNEILGFGGRTIGNSPAKYINTRETVLFKKAELLYGLNRIYHQLSREREVYLVEGYLDVIACQKNGVYAVAPLGTALTSGQIIKLKRYVDRFNILFDGDAAGRKAALRSSELLAENGMDGSVLLLPEGQDPFDYFSSHSADDFRAFYAEENQNIYDFIISEYLGSGELSPAQKKRTAERFSELLPRITDGLVRDEFKQKIADRLAIDVAYLEGGRPARQRTEQSRREITIQSRTERDFIMLLCDKPEYIRRSLSVISPEDLNDEAARYIYTRLLEVRNEENINMNTILDQFKREEVRDYITTWLFKTPMNQENPEKTFNDHVCKIKLLTVRGRNRDINQKINDCLMSGDEEKLRELQEEKIRIKLEEEKLKEYLST